MLLRMAFANGGAALTVSYCSLALKRFALPVGWSKATNSNSATSYFANEDSRINSDSKILC